MTEQDIEDLFNSVQNTVPIQIEYRAYYDEHGKIITYTTEKPPGDYIIITGDQYAESRHDARVIDGQLTYTHKRSHVSKLVKSNGGQRTSKYDMSIIVTEGESSYYILKVYEIKR
jgi:hypothetical protein